MIVIVIYKRMRGIEIFSGRNRYVKYMLLPSFFYFLLVSISSPWKTLRYVLPICGLSFILVFYYLYVLLENIVSKKALNRIFAIIFIVMFIMPMWLHIPIQELYTDRAEIVEKLSNELNLPTIYAMRSNGNRFLDDIYLFSKIDESYIARDIEYTKENVQKIFENKDISKGIIVFINTQQNNKEILENICEATNLEKWKHLKRLNACDVYYVK